MQEFHVCQKSVDSGNSKDDLDNLDAFAPSPPLKIFLYAYAVVNFCNFFSNPLPKLTSSLCYHRSTCLQKQTKLTQTKMRVR